MLPHITWPVVVLAVVLLFRLAIKHRDTWWRLIAGIGVMLVMLTATLIVCVVVLGTQVPGFRLPVLTWTPAPAATASPRSSPMVTVSPAATASPSASGVYAGHDGQAGSVQRNGRAAAPRPARPARTRSRSPAPRVRAGRDTGGRPRSGSPRSSLTCAAKSAP